MKKLHLLKSLFLYASLALCSTACVDDDFYLPNPEEPDQATCRLTFINLPDDIDTPDEIPEGEDANYTGIEYNEKGYVSRIYETRDTDDDEFKFIYNSDNQVIKAEDYAGGEVIFYYTYEYTDGLPTTTTEYVRNEDGDGFTVVSVTRCKYDSKKRPVECKSDNNPITSTSTRDNKGNVTKQEAYAGEKLLYRVTYENYDDNPTPYSGIKGLPAGVYFNNISKNNPGKMVSYYDTNRDGVMQDNETEVTTYTYTYNSEGYPAEITEMSGKYTITDNFDYSCD